MAERESVLVRLDPKVHDALARWARDEVRSANAQVGLLRRESLRRAGRLPSNVGEMPRRGRPPGEQAKGA